MIETIVVIGVILAIGGYFTWLHIKIKTLEEAIINFPSVEDLAVAIMNAKIPIKALPPDLQDRLQTMGKSEDLKKSSSYIG